MKNSLSQQNPNPENLIKSLIKRVGANIFVSMIAIVQSVDYENQTLDAIPAISGLLKDGDLNFSDIQLPKIYDIPFQCFQGGDWAITVPIAKGDEVLLVFTDYDFSAWWQNGGFQKSEHLIRHHYSSAMAIVGYNSQPRKIANYNPNGIDIRNRSGTESISIWNGNAVILSPNIILNGNTVVNGAFKTTGTTTLQGKDWLSHTHGNGNQGQNTLGVN